MRIHIVSPGVRYGDVGKCIYCNAENCDLTLEHIVPSGLGGNYKLPASSCEECRVATHKFETYCQYKMFGSLRVRLGLSRTAPIADFPLPIICDTGKVEKVLVPPDEYPRILALARFPEPGLLIGRQPKADFQWKPWRATYGEDHLDTQTKYAGKGYLSPEFDPQSFARLIAKVAHGCAIARLGLDAFAPLLQDLIRFGSETPFNLVGGGMEEIPAPDDGILHWIKLSVQDSYLVAQVRLFAFIGAPVFKAVVGHRYGNKMPSVQDHLDTRDIEILFEFRE